MAKLIIVYLIVLISSAFGFVSNAYVMNKSADIYFCQYAKINENDCKTAQRKIAYLKADEDDLYSDMFFGKEIKTSITLP